jgi:phenylpropionate dioxygenase-like ring-hydroxylating dioxygenase large terminal subunit
MRRYNDTTREAFDIGFGPTLPDKEIMENGRVPTAGYLSDSFFEAEREIFGKVWLYAGRVSELPNPGDWLVREVEIRGASVIVINDGGTINAFHNVCTHRGMRLLWENRGSNRRILCPYHAWSFGTEGELKALPDEEAFPQVCKADLKLKPVHVDTWAGFMFINLDPEPRMSLREYLGPIADRFEDAPFDAYSCVGSVNDVTAANYKLGYDAASEGYHVNSLHPLSARPWAISNDNPHSHWLGWEPLGPHRMYSVEGKADFKFHPDKPIHEFTFTTLPCLMQTADASKQEREGLADTVADFPSHPDVNPIGVKHWGSDAYGFFPVGSLTVMSTGWWFNSYWPIAKNSCRWLASWYFLRPKTRREQFATVCAMAQYRDVLTEDNFSIRGQQAGLASGAIDQVYFGEAEVALRHISAVMTGAVDSLSDQPVSAFDRVAAE